MSSSDQQEEARIEAWRAERKRVAEQEKAARLAARNAARAEEEKEEAVAQDAAVNTLLEGLPDEEKIRPFLLARAQWMRLRDLYLLLILVIAPLVLVSSYLGLVATRFHESVSVISISKLSDDGSGAAQGVLGALGSPRGLSDVFAADAFLSSSALSGALELETGLVSHLRSGALDPVQRLREGDLSRFVNSVVDVQTGLLTLRVRLPDPERAREVNLRLIDLVASHVNKVQEASRSERMDFAEGAVSAAEAEMRDAREALSALQIGTGEIDPRMRLEAAQDDIRQIEVQIRELRFENDKGRIAGGERRYDIERREQLILRLENELSSLRENLTMTGEGGPALGQTMMRHDMAQLRLDMAQAGLVAALETRRDAQRAVELERSVVHVIAPPTANGRVVRPRPGLVLLITLLAGLSGFFLVRSLLPERGPRQV